MTEEAKVSYSSKDRPDIFTAFVPLKPNFYPETTEFIKAFHHSFWTVDEFSFVTDFDDYNTKMTQEEREVVVRTLSAISQIEVAVKTFWGKIGDTLPHPGIIDAGYVLANSEVIHSRAYSRLLERLGLEDVFENLLELPVMRGRVDYLRKYTKKFSSDKRRQFVYSIILFTLFIENVSLFSQFFVILWFNRDRSLLKDSAQQIAYTRNEEQLHAEFGIYLIRKIREEHPDLFDEELHRRVTEEVQVAIKAERKVIDWILGSYSSPGLSPDILKSFVERRIDDVLEKIGYDRQFADSPLRSLDSQHRWMEEENLGDVQVDFFNMRPTSYGKSNASYDLEDLFD